MQKTDLRKLDRKEWYALQQLVGMHSALERCSETMEKLAKSAGAWQLYRAGTALIFKAIDSVFHVMDKRQLRNFYLDMSTMRFSLEVYRNVVPDMRELGYQVIDEQDLETLIERAMEMSCMGCTKSGHAVKECELHRIFTSSLHWDVKIDRKQGGRCPLRYACDDDIKAIEEVEELYAEH